MAISKLLLTKRITGIIFTIIEWMMQLVKLTMHMLTHFDAKSDAKKIHIFFSYILYSLFFASP